ncbi:MAG: DUF1294 domain-containing protein [Oscillospiraceae bacterium]|nr:DUF1294 domain-containing protein [Oscillospiraceae bacterium]
MIYLLIYLAAISLFAMGITMYDKRAARRNKRRVPERTLLLIAALGGSVAMLATMWVIRHKTRHMKFMVGIPVIIAVQVAAAILVWRLLP